MARMLLKNTETWDMQEKCHTDMASKSPEHQRLFSRLHEHANEVVARVRKREGRATHAIYGGKATERWRVVDGKLVKEVTRLGELMRGGKKD